MALVEALFERGVLAKITEKLRVVRGGGYVGVDAVLLLLFYFACGAREGLKKFDGRVSAVRERLAALGGRASLPTQSSMSRVLRDLTCEAVHLIGPWLLREGAQVADVLRHSSMSTRDALGRAWHVFHYDPTKTVLRQRALPEGDDLPPARRRADGFAAAGYSGRKRGEVQISRSVLQHAGSRLWLDTRVAPGNGEPRAHFGCALAATVEVCNEIGHPRNRAVFVSDGEFGGAPYMTAVRDAGVSGITRLNRPSLLDQPDIWRRMASHQWHLVPDSRSGPRRSAMDLGIITLPPGKTSARDDGTPFDAFDVRVVVSRFANDGDAKHGQVIDGWQYEMFVAVDLDPEGWPAADVVATYHGRSGQENRFAQEDHELGLDRILSYSPAGQELACIIGLLLWNLRVVHGFRLDPLPEERAPALPRVHDVDPRPVPERFVEQVEVSEDIEPTPDVTPTHPAPRNPQVILAGLLSQLDLSLLLSRHPARARERKELSSREDCFATEAVGLRA